MIQTILYFTTFLLLCINVYVTKLSLLKFVVHYFAILPNPAYRQGQDYRALSQTLPVSAVSAINVR